MNYRVKGGIVLALSMVLVAAAFAAENRLDVTNPVQVNGKQLATGNYKLRWNGSGDNVEVQFLKGDKVLATVPAKVEKVSSRYDRNALVVQNGGNGERSLVEARFGGKNYKLVFTNEAAQAEQTNHAGGGDGKTAQ